MRISLDYLFGIKLITPSPTLVLITADTEDAKSELKERLLRQEQLANKLFRRNKK